MISQKNCLTIQRKMPDDPKKEFLTIQHKDNYPAYFLESFLRSPKNIPDMGKLLFSLVEQLEVIVLNIKCGHQLLFRS